MLRWPHNPVPDGQYAAVAAASTRSGILDLDAFKEALPNSVAEDHWCTACPGPLVEFHDGSATFLFAQAGDTHADRTLLAIGHPAPPLEVRDAAYQRGYPLPEMFAGRPVDRGHLIPYTGGGQYGPNLFVQDRALNRGWSRDGRGYRALERAAVAGSPNTLMFARPRYIDDSDVPGFIDLGHATSNGVVVHTFRNRYDPGPGSAHRRDMSIVLPGATNAQIGALGEETASVLLSEDRDPLGDGARIAYDVRTRYASTTAGRLTRAGDLRRPAWQRSRTEGCDQTRRPDVAERLTGQLIVIDFAAMLAQRFPVNNAGKVLRAAGPPIECAAAAQRALEQIVGRRGQL